MKWQPISKAPKNPYGEFFGPTILVWCTADNMPWPAYWGAAAKTNDAYKGTWWMVNDGENTEFEAQTITHWMPLPEPPPETEET